MHVRSISPSPLREGVRGGGLAPLVLRCLEVAPAPTTAALHGHHLRPEQRDDLHVLGAAERTTRCRRWWVRRLFVLHRPACTSSLPGHAASRRCGHRCHPAGCAGGAGPSAPSRSAPAAPRSPPVPQGWIASQRRRRPAGRPGGTCPPLPPRVRTTPPLPRTFVPLPGCCLPGATSCGHGGSDSPLPAASFATGCAGPPRCRWPGPRSSR